MKFRCLIRSRRSEAGVALLIAIFVLLLICVVGIALMVASGTETALAGNYRSATGVYYAALAGLEEGRGRLLARNLNYFNKTQTNFMPTSGASLAYGEVRYILNPVGGEDVLTAYPDTEYTTEFGTNPLGTPPTVNSVSTVAGIPGPIYKWVRINAVSEKSLNLDVNGNGNGDQEDSLFYDGSHLNHSSAAGFPAFEITALASLPKPNGSQKLLQYVVAPVQLNLSFPATLTLLGNGTGTPFSAPVSTAFYIKGNDAPTCTPGLPTVPAIGVTTHHDQDEVSEGITNTANYPGSTPAPSVSDIQTSLPANLQDANALNILVQTIEQNADKIINTSASQSDLPSAMSPTNPMTIVVNGDLNLSGSFTGYGLLLVTGQFSYGLDASWNGIVMVVGQGTVIENGSGGGGGSGNGAFNGAMLVAHIVGTPPNPLSFGSITYTLSNQSGQGIYRNSCWIKKALPITSYQTLSFHEIPQQ